MMAARQPPPRRIGTPYVTDKDEMMARRQPQGLTGLTMPPPQHSCRPADNPAEQLLQSTGVAINAKEIWPNGVEKVPHQEFWPNGQPKAAKIQVDLCANSEGNYVFAGNAQVPGGGHQTKDNRTHALNQQHD
jgi:hypothetical protein